MTIDSQQEKTIKKTSFVYSLELFGIFRCFNASLTQNEINAYLLCEKI